MSFSLFSQLTLGQSQLSLNRNETYNSTLREDGILVNGSYRSFYFTGDKRTDFVNGCENLPGFQKNILNLSNLIHVKQIGEDNQCDLNYDSSATDKDKKLYGVGMIGDASNQCEYCSGTAQLVAKRNILITNAHVFYNKKKGQMALWKNFRFRVKVFIPEERRKNAKELYEYRQYKIKRVFFGTNDPLKEINKDFAFIELDMPVSEVVDGIVVKRKYWIEPMQFKPNENEDFHELMVVGLNGNKEMSPYRTCDNSHFSGSALPNSNPLTEFNNDLIAHDGDTLPGYSGASIFKWGSNGAPYMVALHRSRDLDEAPGKYNVAIKSFSFAKEFNKFVSESDQKINTSI